MTIWIDQETRKRVNIYAPYKGRSRLDTEEIRAAVGVIQIEEPQPPADYSAETYFRNEVEDAPYVVYEKKAQEVLDEQASIKAYAESIARLIETDYLFTVDRFASLDQLRRDALIAERETCREVIRDHKLKYPNHVG